MKQKLIFLVLFLTNFLFANDSISVATEGLSGELDIVASVSPKDGNLMKAYLYEYGYPKENLKPDPQKALEYYKKAFDEKNPIAAYKLGVIAWQIESKENKFEGAPLQFFLNAGKFKPLEQANLNLIAGGIYLYQQGNFKEALTVLEKPLKAKHATAELYTALSYFSLGQEGKANEYLTLACTNRTQNQDIKSFCESNNAVEKVDLRKGASIEKDYPTVSCAM